MRQDFYKSKAEIPEEVKDRLFDYVVDFLRRRRYSTPSDIEGPCTYTYIFHPDDERYKGFERMRHSEMYALISDYREVYFKSIALVNPIDLKRSDKNKD